MKRTDETAPAADGGADSPFLTVSSEEVTTKERVTHAVDSGVIAPFRVLWNDWRGRIGILIVLLYVFVGTAGVALIPVPRQDPQFILQPPFTVWQFPLGTNTGGQGVLALTVHATPDMLRLVVAGGLFATVVGTTVGMVAGYKGGVVDQALMLVTDVMLTIPGLPLLIVLAFLFSPKSPYVVGFILAINAWSGLARSVRSQMLPLRQIEYIESSRVLGASLWTILRNDVLPNVMPYVLVNFVYSSRQIIFAAVGLYYLGVLPTNKPNWGVMLDRAYSSGGALYGWDAAHWLIVPMVAIVLLSLGLILLVQAADQLANPRIKARHERTTESEPAAEGTPH